MLSLLAVAPVSAQTTNPNVVEFLPSADHYTILPSGQPAVTRYDLVFYQQGATSGFWSASLGKPSPQADGVIRAGLDPLLLTWPPLDTYYQARITAVGPLGTLTSSPSNTFVYLCNYALSPTGTSFPDSGGSGTTRVTADSHCGWTAAASVAWVKITGGASGFGTASVSFTAAPNTGVARTGTINVEGQVFTVSQAARLPAPPFNLSLIR